MQEPQTSFTSQPLPLLHANIMNQSAIEQTTLTISSWNVTQEIVASFHAIFTPKNVRKPLVMGISKFTPEVFKAVGTRVDQTVRNRPAPIN